MAAGSKYAKTTISWRIGIILVLLLLFGGAVFVLSIFRAPIPTVIILPLQERTPSKLQIVAEGWWWWLKVHLRGPERSILLSVNLIDLKNPLVSSNLPLPKAEYSSSNGFQVWILNDRELQCLLQQIQGLPGAEVISKPRIQTASGIHGSFFVGQMVPLNGTNQPVGFELKCLLRLRREFIDLTSTFTFTEIQPGNRTAIRTNVAVRSRIQIPQGSGVFLLNADRRQTDGKITAVMISPTVR